MCSYILLRLLTFIYLLFSALRPRCVLIKRVYGSRKFCVRKAIVVSTRDTTTIALDKCFGDRDKHWPAVHPGFEQNKAMTWRIDPDVCKDPQIPVFLWRFSNHDFGLWQIETNGSSHVYTLSRVGGA